MNTRHSLYLGLLMAALIVAACSPKATPQPTTAPAPTDRPAPAATTEVLVSAVGGSQVGVGFTEEGAPYRGNPNAPVTLLEYTDFQ